MPFAVVIHEKGGQPRRQDFDKNEVTIGRVQGNDIVLPKQNVSKKHSRIVVKDGKFIIVDLKSTNGTYVNGRKIASPMVIKETDKIYIGDFILSTEGTGAVSTPAPEAKAEPEIPKIDPPRKAPAPPAPAKVVPTPPTPVTAPKRAVAPSGAATAVSYGSPPAATPARRPDADTVPPVTLPKPAAPTIAAVSQAPFDQLFAHALETKLSIPNAWTSKTKANEAATIALTEFANKLPGSQDASMPSLVAEVAGAGPIQPYIGDSTVTAIYVDGPNQIRIEGEGPTQLLDTGFSSIRAVCVVATRLLAGCGVHVNEGQMAQGTGDDLSVSFIMHGAVPHLSIERVTSKVPQIESLVADGVLDDKLAGFLMTALALNRTVIVSGNHLESAQKLVGALVDATWQDERVVVIDPTSQMKMLTGKPHLNQTSNMDDLCHHAGMLKAHHLVFNGVCGTEILPVIKAANRVKGGAILIVQSFNAALALEVLCGGLALTTLGTASDAADYLKSHIDVIAHVEVDTKQVERLKEVVDLDGTRRNLFSVDGDADTSKEPPAWLSQAVRDGYEVDLALFQ
jgi:pilus assembly protein CpaF